MFCRATDSRNADSISRHVRHGQDDFTLLAISIWTGRQHQRLGVRAGGCIFMTTTQGPILLNHMGGALN